MSLFRRKKGRSYDNLQGNQSKQPAQVRNSKIDQGYNFALIIGETNAATPSYKQALEKLVQQIAPLMSVDPLTKIKTFYGSELPEPGDEAGIEAYVRMKQFQLELGLLAFEVEFRKSEGFNFMIAYMRR